MASSRRSSRLSDQALKTPQSTPIPNGNAEDTSDKKRKANSARQSANGSTISTANGTTKGAKSKKATSNGMPPPPVPPSTPKNNKRRKTASDNVSPTKAPPLTPTPSAVGIIASGSRQPTTPSQTAALDPRPAEPHATNAPLSTPGGTRVVAYPPNGVINNAVNKASLMLPTTTTDTLLEEACAHLIKVDPKLEPVIEKYHCKLFSPQGLQEEIEPFMSLVSSIMAQQVSGAAAKSIKNKFIALFPSCANATHRNPFPTPQEVAASDIPTLRSAGLSQRKAEYVQGLAEKFAAGELSAEMLVRASDEEVLEKLVAVRGLGRWSVEMFSCFALKRMDVFSTGDLGVQRGMAAYMGRDVAKLKGKGGKWKYMSEKDMLEISERFAPYRTLFMWYMWRIEDVDVDAIQGD